MARVRLAASAGANVTDVAYDKAAILAAIQAHCANGHRPGETIYGDGNAGERIAELLTTVPLSIEKKLAY